MNINLGALEYPTAREQAEGRRTAQRLALTLAFVILAAVLLASLAVSPGGAGDNLVAGPPRATEVLRQASRSDDERIDGLTAEPEATDEATSASLPSAE